jgi:hypothetical protein
MAERSPANTSCIRVIRSGCKIEVQQRATLVAFFVPEIRQLKPQFRFWGRKLISAMIWPLITHLFLKKDAKGYRYV